MSIKRILIPLPGSGEYSSEFAMGLCAAKALQAHVEALFITEPPPIGNGRIGTGTMAYGGRLAAVARPIDWYAEENERLARETYTRFAHACTASGMTLLGPGQDADTAPAASWRQEEGEYADVATRRAAAFDLMVAASATVMESLKDIAEQSLLQARRPVLLAPTRLDSDLTGTAMIAWDESPECWHAVSAAIPFLQLAKSVQIVSVDRDSKRRQSSQVEVLAYLRCHGIMATGQVVAPHLRSVGDSLLAAAGEQEADLMVMGAYSHSRLREMLLGGATRHILQNASARPVLLAH
jgi:nucleotide-binding universal stress UspA family protein